ncbi:MAG: hypothetical protein ACK46X_16755 [Candidatus Sericytochromatia bacterium]
MAIDVNKLKATVQAASAAPAKPADAPEAKAVPGRQVDVANFRLLPLSGAPKVSAKVDPTLGKTGVDAFILNKLEGFGKFGAMAANGVRLFTRVTGPVAYWFSTVRNVKLLSKAYGDETIDGKSKALLTLGTIGTAIGAAAATVAAAPAKLLGMVGVGLKGQVNANKMSSIAGGIAGIAYATINMVETLRNPDAKPAERFFSKAGFGLGALGFVFGSTALAISAGFGPAAAIGQALPWLLPVASKVATFAGLAGLATWISQTFLGKNEWLNEKLKGTALG